MTASGKRTVPPRRGRTGSASGIGGGAEPSTGVSASFSTGVSAALSAGLSAATTCLLRLGQRQLEQAAIEASLRVVRVDHRGKPSLSLNRPRGISAA